MSSKIETRAGTGEVFYRSFAIDSSALSGANGNRTVEVAWASEEPVQREFGTEVLQCTTAACDLERLNSRAAVLYEHKSDAQIGVVVPGTARFDSDRKGRALIKFSKSTLGQEQYQDVIDGVRALVSVGYSVDRYEVQNDDTYVAVQWQPLEISLVSIPADISVGVGRSKFMKTETEAVTAPGTPVGEQKAMERERTRVCELQKLAVLYRYFGAEEKLPGAIATGMSVEKFKASLVDDIDPEAIRPTPGDHTPGNVSFQRTNRSIGAQIVQHRSVQEMFRGGKKTVSFDLPGISSIRATLGTSDFGGTVEHLGGPVFANQRLTVADLLANGTTGSGSVRYPVENSFTPGAETVPESGDKPEQAFDVEPKDMPARKIAAWVRISTELLADSRAAADYLTSRLSFAVLRKEEEQILWGNGQGVNLQGIFTTEGVQGTIQAGDTVPDAIRKAVTRVAINSDFEASGIIVHPADWEQCQLAKAETSGNYLVGNVFARTEMGDMIRTPSLWGLPVVVTKSTPVGHVLTGDFQRAAQLFRRQGLLIEMSNQDADNFTKNLVTILAELRALVATYAPAAFVDLELDSAQSGS